MIKKPKVSVIMGVYNAEKTLVESLDSLLNQTFQDFNIIACDDGSTDKSLEMLNSYQSLYKDKIIVLENKINKGLNYTLNHCLEHATGEYVARMDADDVSLPMRFEKQVFFLDENKEYAVVSSPMIYFDETGDWGVGHPAEFPQKETFCKRTPFAHAPSMIRLEAFQAVEGYTVHKKLLRLEDYHLWIKMYDKGYIGCNLNEPLYKMRDDHNAYSRRSFKARKNEMYVKYLALKTFKLPWYNIFSVIKPIILFFVPKFLYNKLHKKRLNIN